MKMMFIAFGLLFFIAGLKFLSLAIYSFMTQCELLFAFNIFRMFITFGASWGLFMIGKEVER